MDGFSEMMGKAVWRVSSECQRVFWCIFNGFEEGVIVVDKNARLLFFNPAVEKFLGINFKNLSPTNWSSVFTCFYPDKTTPFPFEKLLQRITEGEEIPDVIVFMPKKESSDERYLKIRAGPIKNENSLIIGGMVIIKDITANRFAHMVLRGKDLLPVQFKGFPFPTSIWQHAEHDSILEDWTKHQWIEYELKKLASVVEQTADSVIITDKEGVIEYANHAFEKTTGYKLHEVIGQTPKILKSGKHKPHFYKKLWQTILSGKSYQGTIVNKKKNQELYWCEQTITPLKDSTGNITNFVAVIKDISELRQRQKYEFHLNIAREIQQRFSAPDISLPGFDIASASYSAAETSGDYLDFIRTTNDELLLAVGDVCGHGIGAALIMAETRAYLRAFAKIDSNPDVVLSRLNQELVSDLGDSYYVTLILVRLDIRRKTMEYASAGHIPAYLIDASGGIEHVLESTGLPLGFLKEEIPKSNKINLVPGNMLVFFTDGITEAEGLDGSQFGPSRALGIIQKYRKHRASYIAKKLSKTIHAFTAIQPQEDDISTIICKVI